MEDFKICKWFHSLSSAIDPYIKELYPKVKKIHWTYNMVRGGNRIGDHPRAEQPHLDYYQDDKMRLEFHEKYPVFTHRCKLI